MPISPDDVEAWEETIAVLSDAETMRQLAAADDELRRNHGESQAQLDAAMRKRQPSS